MRLTEISIDNYRSFNGFSVKLEDFTVVIGRNNAGKTSLAHALELVFHPGSDRSIPVYKEDFCKQDKPIVIEAIFDGLDEKDTQAFFSLRGGSPGPDKFGVVLEAVWEDGEILCERFLTRPERDSEDRRTERYTLRYRQFIHYSYISPYREAESSSRFARGSDYRAIVTEYAGDYLQPVDSLVAEIRSIRQDVDEEIEQRGGFEQSERHSVYSHLNKIMDYLEGSPIEDPSLETPDDYGDRLAEFADEWSNRYQGFRDVLQSAVTDGGNAITHEILESYERFDTKVSNLIQRCRVQLALIGLRDSVIGNQEFIDMESDLADVLGLLLPEAASSVEPFPVQDDRLFSEALIKLGNTDLLQCGSGYQSTFAIGLRIVRILAEMASGVTPRLLILAIEEPEAHLHPHKQRHVITALRELQNQLSEDRQQRTQCLITTHSSNILAGLSFEELVIVRLQEGRTKPIKLQRETFLENWLTRMNVRKSNHRTRIKKLIQRWLTDFFHQFGEVLFARFTLFLEGHSERGAFPVWAMRLSQPVDLDRLGISIFVANGSQLTYAAQMLKGLGIPFLLVCDRKDEHNVSTYEENDYILTNEAHFEDEILKTMPLSKVLRAVGYSLNESERDDLLKFLTSPGGVPGFAEAETWGDLIMRVKNGELEQPAIDKLKSIIKDKKVGSSNRRYLLKGSDIGALLADEVTDESEIPKPYLEALKIASTKAKELAWHG
jgi:predicted ATP-dependent endonuclease of OLD family